MSNTETKVRIDPNLISDADYEIGCRILSSSVRSFFSKPGVREEYEAWMKTEEGQLADLSPKERQKRLDAAKKKAAGKEREE